MIKCIEFCFFESKYIACFRYTTLLNGQKFRAKMCGAFPRNLLIRELSTFTFRWRKKKKHISERNFSLWLYLFSPLFNIPYSISELSASFCCSLMCGAAFFFTTSCHTSIRGKINVVLPFHKFNSNLRSIRFCCWKIKVFNETTTSNTGIWCLCVCVCSSIYVCIRAGAHVMQWNHSKRQTSWMKVQLYKFSYKNMKKKKIAEKYTLYKHA